MQDETSRSDLFVAIDRATRWVHLAVFPDKTAQSAQVFLQQVIDKAPFKLNQLLTDNGKELTDRYVPNGEREPTGNPLFDPVCTKNEIEHRLTKPAHPQTNGMVERFNGRISGIVKTTHFDSAKELKETMINYLRIYNDHIPQRNIGHLTPIQKLKEWQEKSPELFKKQVYNLSGLDNVDIPSEGLVWLRELGFVRLYRTTLKNEHRHYALYLPDAAQLGEVTRTEFEAIHDPHWQIEPYHRAIKPVCPIEHSQVRGEAGVRNHVFAALSGYIHLQTMCLAELITNTDALQRNLFNEVISEFIGKTASMIKGLVPKFKPSYNA